MNGTEIEIEDSMLYFRPEAYAQDAPPQTLKSGLGMIPEEWTFVRLGKLFKFKNGLNKAKSFFGSGTPIVNYMDVFTNPGLRSAQIEGRVKLSAKEMGNFGVNRGDVFFTRTSETLEDIGVASVMLEDSPNTVFSGFVLRGRPTDRRLDDEYKKYCFSAHIVRQQIVSSGTYTTRALTNGRTLSAVYVPLPPIYEQRAIAGALGDMDALLEGLDRLIAKKRDIKRATMQQLLTGRTRLPGFQEEWAEMRVGDIGATYGGLAGKAKDDFGVGHARYVTFLNVLENVVVDPRRFGSVRVKPGERQNRVRRGDVLLNGTSETPDDLAMAAVASSDDEELFLNSFCFGLRIHNPSEHVPLFLAYFFRGPPGRQALHALAQGATRYNLSKNRFKALAVSLPQYDEQNAIAAILSDMASEIIALEARRDKTRNLKQAMMQELLTGRTRLVEPEVACG